MKSIVLCILSVSANFTFANSYAGCPIAGPADAPIIIEEFVDFQCRYCAKGAEVMSEVLKNYPTEVRLVLRNLPLAAHGAKSQTAAKAVSAACLQDPRFGRSLQEELFENQTQFSQRGKAFILEAAEKIGINVGQMKDDMESDTVAKMLKDDQALALEHNFYGTPSFTVGSTAVVGTRSYEEIKGLVDLQLPH